jgi:glycerol-3-phosphate acyltransferase PlsY
VTYWAGVAIAFAYFLGMVVSAVILARIGESNPRTFGDSWTGDHALDTLSVILWPMTFFVVAAIAFGGVAAELILRRK